MFGLSRHWIRSPIGNRDDILFVFSLVHFFDQKEVQSDFALKTDEAFLYIDQKGSSDVGDDLWMLMTTFDRWYPTLMEKIVDIGDQSGLNRHILLLSPTNFIFNIRH